MTSAMHKCVVPSLVPGTLTFVECGRNAVARVTLHGAMSYVCDVHVRPYRQQPFKDLALFGGPSKLLVETL